MSIDSAASLLQTVNTISTQMTRGLTISVNNTHMHYQLKNMEYWSETDCFNAPTLTIGPGRWGVGAFRSKITCGTTGILCYELVPDPWILRDKLFLLIGWKVPLLGDNTYFTHIAHVADSPDFPRNRSERKKLHNMLMKSQIRAGDSISIHICPEVKDVVIVKDNKDDKDDKYDKDDKDDKKDKDDKYDKDDKNEKNEKNDKNDKIGKYNRDDKNEDKNGKDNKENNDDKNKNDDKDQTEHLTSFSVCATMATSAIANLKVEINPYSEPITTKIKSPLSISIPKQKFSFAKYMEESFQSAENIVNEALKKYIGIDECNTEKK